MPLKHIPFIISPDLLKTLCEMGHGDTIGHTIPQLLKAILELMPLDTYVLAPVSLMQVVPSDVGKVTPTIWDSYKEIIKLVEPKAGVQTIERFTFYTAAKSAYAIVHTGETSQYGNIILQKGVVLP